MRFLREDIILDCIRWIRVGFEIGLVKDFGAEKAELEENGLDTEGCRFLTETFEYAYVF